MSAYPENTAVWRMEYDEETGEEVATEMDSYTNYPDADHQF